MKKRFVFVMVLAALLFACHAAMAGPIYMDQRFYVAIGESIKPDYPDLSSYIPGGLKMSDYNITYKAVTSRYITVDEDGTVHVDAQMMDEFTGPVRHGLSVIYTPKGANASKAQYFNFTLIVYHPLTEFAPNTDRMVMALNESAAICVSQTRNSCMGNITMADSKGILELDMGHTNDDEYVESDAWYLTVTGKKTGSTTLTVTAYNGKTFSIPVTVKNRPTQVTFGKEIYTCYEGETITLDVGLGEGCSVYQPYGVSYPYGPLKQSQQDWRTFTAHSGGLYEITFQPVAELTGTAKLKVYDKEKCVAICQEQYTYVGSTMVLLPRDENGQHVSVPLRIISGGDCATLNEEDWLVAGKKGTVVLKATSFDGSTVEKTIHIVDKPKTAEFASGTMAQMEIGDEQEMKVSFDQGMADYTLSYSAADEYEYGLAPIRIEGKKVIAQAPGIVYLHAEMSHLGLYPSMTIQVADGEGRLEIVKPDGPLAIGQTFQLSVRDRTGKEYPASYSVAGHEAAYLTVTPAGNMRGIGRYIRCRVNVKLEDGREMYFYQDVVAWPGWLRYGNVSVPIDYKEIEIGSIETDVGPIPCDEVVVTIKDAAIARTDGIRLYLLKEGKTQVTLKSQYSAASVTFTLTVEKPTDRLYCEPMLDVPSNYSSGVPLPVVTDFYGNVVPVTWKITYESLGLGCPYEYAFALKGNRITCRWMNAFCQITATSATGATIQVNAYGFRLPDRIGFVSSQYSLDVGEAAQMDLEMYEQGYKYGPVTWQVADESIVRFEEKYAATGMPTVIGLKPGKTTVTATLLNGVKASCTVIVREPRPITSISFLSPDMTVYLGNWYTFQLKILPNDTTDSTEVTWSSSNKAVAEYSEISGLQMKKPGTVTITAALQCGKKASIQLTVKEKQELALPYRLAMLEEGAYEGTNFTHVFVPQIQLSRIESRTFANCPRLVSITLWENIRYVAPDAFAGSEHVVIYCQPGSYAEQYAKENGIPYEYGDGVSFLK